MTSALTATCAGKPHGGYSYVFKQPTTPEEEALCKEAMEGCPVEAIGNNGED
jgi:ferredoxin